MRVVLHPCAPTGTTPGGSVRVWVGVFGSTRKAHLEWRLGRTAAAPVPLRPLRSARPVPTMSAESTTRAFTGLYEFREGIAPGTRYTVRVGATVDGSTAWSDPLLVRTLPSRVPPAVDGSFNVLLVSCFHEHEDPTGAAGTIIDRLPAAHRPHLTFLMGDQVYLDLPLLTPMREDVRWLAAKFERDYAANWRGPLSYARVLDAAPSAAVPDDHEYWNNAPHPATLIPLTHGRNGRDRWREAARALYDAFQVGEAEELAEADRYQRFLDVPPLSFFLMDNRTFRRRDLQSSLGPGGLDRFRSWAEHVSEHRRVPVVVTGQSLLQEPATRIRGAFFDRHLANYRDYPEIMATITDLTTAGHPVLCLTGDVHYGRVAEARVDAAPGNPVHEIIASPSSLVTSPVSTGQALVRSVLRRRDPWPRHRDPQPPPEVVVPAPGGAKWKCRMLDGAKGNHVTLLTFRAVQAGVELQPTYWMVRQPEERHALPPIKLAFGR